MLDSKDSLLLISGAGMMNFDWLMGWLILKQDAQKTLTRATSGYAMRMSYHCEVRPTFSHRFSFRYKQTMELHPDKNISYSLDVSSY